MCVCVCRNVCWFCALHFCICISARFCLHADVPTQCWEERSSVSGGILLNSHHLKDEEEKGWLNAQKYSMSLASALVSALLLILTYFGKANPTYQDMDKELSSLWLDILTIPKPEGFWSSLALQMWKMWVSLMPNNHRGQSETRSRFCSKMLEIISLALCEAPAEEAQTALSLIGVCRGWSKLQDYPLKTTKEASIWQQVSLKPDEKNQPHTLILLFIPSLSGCCCPSFHVQKTVNKGDTECVANLQDI